MSNSRNSNRTTQRARGIEWGAKRLGDANYNGSPGAEQKRITNRRERLAAKAAMRCQEA